MRVDSKSRLKGFHSILDVENGCFRVCSVGRRQKRKEEEKKQRDLGGGGGVLESIRPRRQVQRTVDDLETGWRDVTALNEGLSRSKKRARRPPASSQTRPPVPVETGPISPDRLFLSQPMGIELVFSGGRGLAAPSRIARQRKRALKMQTVSPSCMRSRQIASEAF